MNARLRRLLDLTVWGVGVGCLSVLVVNASAAAAPARPSPADTWHEECSGCHIAYPPQLLPAASWRALLERLDRHFGVNASLEPARSAAIRAFLEAHAAPGGEVATGAEAPRISRLPWFAREHSEIPADVWRRASVRSPANCGACHPAAERGAFDEHGIRIPR